MKSYYDLLGVRRQAGLHEIEQNYRRHLDRHTICNAGRKLRKKDQLRLQNMRNAFLVLSSPARRQQYDRLLQQAEQRRDRVLDIGGAIVAVSALVIGLVLMGGSAYFRDNDAQVSAPQANAAHPAPQPAGR
jgi:DnaJ-class molecular chaperone